MKTQPAPAPQSRLQQLPGRNRIKLHPAAALAVLAALLTLLAAPSASAATYYWDTDGATAGFGNTAGTWGTDSFWTTNGTGGASLVFTNTTTTNDVVNFSTATLALGSTAAGVTVSGTVEADRINFGLAQPTSTPVILTGGTIRLGGPSTTSNISPSSTNATINSAIVLNNNVQIRGSAAGGSGTVTTLNLNGVISGGFNVDFFSQQNNNSFASAVLGAQNTYTGNTLITCINTLANMEVRLGTTDALPTTTVLTLSGGAGGGSGRYVQLNMNGFNQTLAGLTNILNTPRRFQRIINSTSFPTATLTLSNSVNYTYSGQLGNVGNENIALTKSGAARFTLRPATTATNGTTILNLLYTGPTTINNGILEIAGAGRLGNGNYATNISIASGAALVFSGTNANNLSGTVSGAGTLTNSGTGILTLAGTDTLADTVAASGGTIALNGGSVSQLTVDSGSKVSLPGPAGGTVSNLVFAGSGSMDFDVANSGSLTNLAANGITNNGGAGSITINITGSLPSDGTYTLIAYSGSLQGSGFSAYQLGATPPGKAYALADSGTAVQLVVTTPFFWTGAQSSEWSTNLIGGLLNWTYLGSPIDYTNGAPVLFDDTLTGSSTVDISVANVTPSAVTFNNATTNYTLQGSRAIAGATSLNKSGAATLTVLNDNSYSGPTIISAGTVQVGNGGTSGTLGSGAITDNAILQFNRSDNLSVPVAISGTGAVEQNGSGVLTLAGANGYGGATTINTGTLRLGASDVLPNGSSATVNGLLDLNTFSDTINGLSGSGTVDTVAAGTPTLTVGANNGGGTFSGTIQNTSGTLSLIKTGTGTLTLSGSNTYAGGTTLSGGIIVVTNSASALGTGTFSINGGVSLRIHDSLTITNPIIIGPNSGTAGNGLVHIPNTLSGVSATISGPVTINNGGLAGGHFYALNNTLTVSGVITSTVPILSRRGTVIFSGGGIGYTNLTLNEGILKVGTNNGIATTAELIVAASAAGTFDLNGFNQSLVGITKGGFAGNITNGSASSNSTLTLNGTSTFAGTIDDNGVQKINLTVNGGAFTLTGVNTYSGATTISAGTLVLSNNSAINLTSGLSIAAGASLDTVALTLPPPSSIPLTASGTGTGVGTTAAAIIGVTGLPQDLGSRQVTLNFDGANPALYLSGGTLNLNNNPFTINGSVLANGVYTIIAQSDAAAMTGSVASSTVGGSALTGKIGTVSLSGNTVLLTVSNAGPSGPATLTNSVSSGVLSLSWPAGQGWRLVSQTNSLSSGLNPATNAWFTVPGGIDGSNSITINPANPTVFYRLVYP